jgi:Tfp pilus assembly protein PilF
LDQEEKVLDYLSKAISLEPKNDEYYKKRALTYIRLGENEKAAADIEKAVELNPKNAGECYYSFGYVLFNVTGNKKEAAVYLKKSVEHGDYDSYLQKGAAKAQLAEWGM